MGKRKIKDNKKKTIIYKNTFQYERDIHWMRIALQYADYAKNIGEVPIGAIMVLEERVIGVGWNSSITQNDPTAHAEIVALRNAGKKIKNYRLINTTLYVTLEPCIMCIGAIIHSRIKRLVFGANSHKHNTKDYLKYFFFSAFKNYRLDVKKNIMKNQCENVLTNFFQKKRKQATCTSVNAL